MGSRALGAGASLAGASHLLLIEALVGVCYFAAGLVMLRALDYSGRRSAALDAF